MGEKYSDYGLWIIHVVEGESIIYEVVSIYHKTATHDMDQNRIIPATDMFTIDSNCNNFKLRWTGWYWYWSCRIRSKKLRDNLVVEQGYGRRRDWTSLNLQHTHRFNKSLLEIQKIPRRYPLQLGKSWISIYQPKSLRLFITSLRKTFIPTSNLHKNGTSTCISEGGWLGLLIS